MLRGMEGAGKDWGVGGRVAWIRLALSYLILLRVSELFAQDDGKVHAVYCLRGKEVEFYAGERQMEGENKPEVETVEVRFRGSRGERGACW